MPEFFLWHFNNGSISCIFDFATLRIFDFTVLPLLCIKLVIWLFQKICHFFRCACEGDTHDDLAYKFLIKEHFTYTLPDYQSAYG